MAAEAPVHTRAAGHQPAFAQELQRRLLRLVRVSELCDRACVCQGEVTVAQSYALFALPAEGVINMHDLSVAMNLAGSTMTRVVDQLVQKGLAARAPSEDDRRVVLVGLTHKGRTVRDDVTAHFEKVFADVASRVAAEDRQLLLRTLDELSSAIADAADRCCPAEHPPATP